MNNDELKKKIVEILEETEHEWTEDKNGYILQIFYDKLADALIAAGIGDVSSEKAMRELAEAFHREKCAEYDPINYKLQKAEHRAEVAERAFFNFALFCAKTVSPNYVRNTSEENQREYARDICKEWGEKAEKELTEERKDD